MVGAKPAAANGRFLQYGSCAVEKSTSSLSFRPEGQERFAVPSFVGRS
jgi:hypothetical protein